MTFSRPRSLIAIAVALAVFSTGAIASAAIAAPSGPELRPAASSATIWGNSKPTGVSLDKDKSAAELGTRFTPSVSGRVTSIRFFKPAGATGVHTGSIWAPDGTRMANVTFRNETASGWQTAELAKPVALKSGTPYVVSYRVPAGGYYASTENFTGKSASSLVSVSQRNSGVFTYSAPGTHPRSQWRSSQYWADVVFSAEGTRSFTGPLKPMPLPVPTMTPTPTPAPTTAPTPPTTPPSTPAPTSPPATAPTKGFPTRDSAGLPNGWQPSQQVSGNYYVRQAGAVVQDLRITDGTIIIEAANVTLRRIDYVGSTVINGMGSTCYPNLLVEDSDFTSEEDLVSLSVSGSDLDSESDEEEESGREDSREEGGRTSSKLTLLGASGGGAHISKLTINLGGAHTPSVQNHHEGMQSEGVGEISRPPLTSGSKPGSAGNGIKGGPLAGRVSKDGSTLGRRGPTARARLMKKLKIGRK